MLRTDNLPLSTALNSTADDRQDHDYGDGRDHDRGCDHDHDHDRGCGRVGNGDRADVASFAET